MPPTTCTANQEYARTFDRGELALSPARHPAIVTCMDARILPSRAFGLQEGDAHVIRNPGGRARAALRSLIISQRLLGTRKVAVVHHTDCGMLTVNNRETPGQGPGGPRAGHRGVRLPAVHRPGGQRGEDIEFLQATQVLDPATLFRGLLYDVRSGRLTEVRQEVEAGGEARPGSFPARGPGSRAGAGSRPSP